MPNQDSEQTPKPQPTELTNVSSLPQTVSSGAVIVVGESGTADLSEPHDQALLDAGALSQPSPTEAGADADADDTSARGARTTRQKETS